MTRRRVIAIAVAVIVLACAGAAVWWALTRPPSAEDAAERYLAALVEGDFDTIAEMVASPLDEEGRATLADAFAGATYASSAEVEEIVSSGATARVQASIDLGGDRRTAWFDLGLRDGRWSLSDDGFLAVLEATSTIGDSVWVGDALVPVGAVALLPAVYPVSPAPRDVLDGETDISVSNDAPASVEVRASLSDDAQSRAQAELDAYLDRCTVPAAVQPDACGIRIPWAADLATLDSLAYRIEQRPVMALAAETGTFSATGGILVATAMGTTHAGSAGTFTYRAGDWSLYGTVSFRGDAMVLAVR